MIRTVTSGSVQIHAETFGTPGDDPVLLIAGAMAPAVFWDNYFCESLSAHGYHVVRFDNRDIGRSTHFPPSAPGSGVALPYTIDDMVADARAVLDTLSGKKGHIVGHSLGGTIAQLFAVTYPEKTLSLTAIASPIVARGDIAFIETDPGITEALWAVLMANPMHQAFRSGLPEFLKVWRALNGDWPLDEDMAADYTRALYETEIIGPAWNHTHVQSGIREIYPELRQFTKPILFIHGEKDYLPSDPENTRRLAAALPGADAQILASGGHMFFNRELRQILIDTILAHLSKV